MKFPCMTVQLKIILKCIRLTIRYICTQLFFSFFARPFVLKCIERPSHFPRIHLRKPFGLLQDWEIIPPEYSSIYHFS